MYEDDILQGRVVEGMSFNEKVWAVCARVPAGRVTTYGAIARELLAGEGVRCVGERVNLRMFGVDSEMFGTAEPTLWALAE
jgi:hypothetical protein